VLRGFSFCGCSWFVRGASGLCVKSEKEQDFYPFESFEF
jgi:hypothetical protein